MDEKKIDNNIIEPATEAPKPENNVLDHLANLLKTNPKVQEELFNRLGNESIPTQQPPVQQPAQQISQPIQPPVENNIDIVNAPVNEFINYKSNSSNYETELKTHLLLRHPELDGRKVDMVVEEAKNRMMNEYALTGELPINPAKTLRTNSVLVLKEVAEQQKSMEDMRVQSAAIQFSLAEKEFGANYVHEKKAEAEKFIAEQLYIPIEELHSFPPERYAKLLKTYSQRNMTTQEINETAKQVNDLNRILKERAKMLNM